MNYSNQEIVSNQGIGKLDIHSIREQFPVLHQQVNGKPLIYLDNAATNQKPKVVIDALNKYYYSTNSNIHRGIHTLAEQATAAYEETRKYVRQYINANEAEEIIFTKGTTEGLNLVAATYGRANVQSGDEVIITAMEHHSNIVPWQILCEEKQANLKIAPISDVGELDINALQSLISKKTKIVSLVHASNTLGTVNPIKEVIEMAHAVGAVVVIDGAQASSHLDIDVQKLKCDFYAFSSHKCYGPTGVGVLYGKRRLLENMPPYQGGGEMIKEVSFEKTSYNDIPFKFEAGTPNIADVVAFRSALEFVDGLGKQNIAAHEAELLNHAHQQLQTIPEIKLVGTARNKVSVVSFTMENIHHFDIGMMLDARGIAVRTGHHCTQPLMGVLGIEGTARASFSVYNSKEEIDTLVEALERIAKRQR